MGCLRKLSYGLYVAVYQGFLPLVPPYVPYVSINRRFYGAFL